MWDELPLSASTDQQLYPYTEWCPGNTLDFQTMESKLGISHIPYGSEIVYKEHNTAASACSTKAPRKQQDHRATIERLYDLGVFRTQAQPELLELKAIFDEQIKLASDEKQRIPFTISQRILNVYLTRWSAISFISKPYIPYGKTIVNAPFDLDEAKSRQVQPLIFSSSPSVGATEEVDKELQLLPQAEQTDNTDHLNPEVSGGNSV
jgi:hypothetical protein